MLFYTNKKLNALHAPAYISNYVRKSIKDKKAFFRASLNGSMTILPKPIKSNEKPIRDMTVCPSMFCSITTPRGFEFLKRVLQ